jgi:hypothetical protein
MTHFIPFWWALCPKCFICKQPGRLFVPAGVAVIFATNLATNLQLILQPVAKNKATSRKK